MKYAVTKLKLTQHLDTFFILFSDFSIGINSQPNSFIISFSSFGKVRATTILRVHSLIPLMFYLLRSPCLDYYEMMVILCIG